ncbi:helix-turn-helix domain-containing protein [Niallia oryzisoli]|uniref:helix-turn-helix domain-containing protein n=1 Tax=Niallia oryzisoli TaxID=1737571 RepID=UPI003734D880
MTEFGEKLRLLRKEKGLSLRKLSELAGVAPSYLSQVETGKRRIPKVEMLEKIACGLNIPYLDLLMLAGDFPIGKVGDKEDIKGLLQEKVEIRSLPQMQSNDLNYLLSSEYGFCFKGRRLTKIDKIKIKKLIEIVLR